MTNKRNILLAALFAVHVSVEATSSVQLNVFKNKNADAVPQTPLQVPQEEKTDKTGVNAPGASDATSSQEVENPVEPNAAHKTDELVVTAQGGSDATSSQEVKNPVEPNAAQKTEESNNTNASSVVLEIKKRDETKPEENSKSKSSSTDSQDANKGMFASVGAYCSGVVGGAFAATTAHPVLTVAGGAAIVAAVVWTVYLHKTTRRAKTLEQELDELDSAA